MLTLLVLLVGLLVSGSCYSDELQPYSEDTYTIELIVVIDDEFKGRQFRYGMNAKEYILTLLSGAQKLFRHEYLGENINIAVVDIFYQTVFYRREKEPVDRFVEWVAKNLAHKNDEFDFALYFTSKADKSSAALNICEIYSKGGVIVLTDSDSLISTIAHELGHSLHAEHDSDINECRDKSVQYIMHPIAVNIWPKWSMCSSKSIAEYLRSPESICLRNKPSNNSLTNLDFDWSILTYSKEEKCSASFKKYRMLPTQANCSVIKCEQRYGNGVYMFGDIKNTNGLNCSSNGICIDGVCNKITPVDGGWSKLIPDGQCSQSCDGGTQKFRRSCNNPYPKYGGRSCPGPSQLFKWCNMHPCPKKKTFEESLDRQCGEKKLHFNPSYPCIKYCDQGKIPYASGFLFDGTPCDLGLTKKCFNGKCLNVDCKNNYLGQAQNDYCGVCDGGNKNCYSYQNQTSLMPQSYSHTYRRFIEMIPKGSANIAIDLRLTGKQNAYLSIGSATKGFKPSNDASYNPFSGPLRMAGLFFNYTVSSNSKVQKIATINQYGNTNEDLEIAVFDYDSKGVQSIGYSYFGPGKTYYDNNVY